MRIKRSTSAMTVAFYLAYSLRTFAALPTTDWPTIVKPLAKQVPRLEILKDGAESPGVCSGVVLNLAQSVLVTAAHCVAGDPEKMSITVNGRDARVIRSNALIDLALVRFDVQDEQEMPIAPDAPAAGDEVAVAGYAFGIEAIAFQFGRVSQPWNRETKALWLNLDLIFGDSGGAAVDAQGRLVGLSSRIYSQGPAHMAAFVSAQQVREFASGYLRKPKP